MSKTYLGYCINSFVVDNSVEVFEGFKPVMIEPSQGIVQEIAKNTIREYQ